MKKIVIICLCVMMLASCLLTGCGKRVVSYDRGTPAPFARIEIRGIDADVMPISGYIGPQAVYAANGYTLPSLITDKTYSQLQEAGINLIIEQRVDWSKQPETAKQILELSAQYGIKYFLPVDDAFRIQFADDLRYGTVEDVSKITDELYQYESFAGFYFRDEPTSDMFPGITDALSVFNDVRNYTGYSDLQVYLNMLPSVSADMLSNGTEEDITWTKYIERFSDTGVDYLMFDAYPFTMVENEIQASFLNQLDAINQQAKKDNKAWMGYVQTGGGAAMFSSNHRVVNEGEMNWNVNAMLAFGAKGISYYTLVTPPETATMGEEVVNQDALINKYGTKTPFWFYAQKINKHIQAMDHILMNSAHEGIILDNNTSPNIYNGPDLLQSYRCLESVSGDSALIGCFDYQGTVALLVMNNSITEHHAEITLNFDNNYAYEVIQRGISAEITGKSFTLHLEAGESAMVVVQ